MAPKSQGAPSQPMSPPLEAVTLPHEGYQSGVPRAPKHVKTALQIVNDRCEHCTLGKSEDDSRIGSQHQKIKDSYEQALLSHYFRFWARPGTSCKCGRFFHSANIVGAAGGGTPHTFVNMQQ